jgi:hypothetical protein
VLRLLPLVFLCGCAVFHDTNPIDTKFDHSTRNWVEIYQNEIKIAVENGDIGAYHFFMQELIKEKVRLRKLNEKKKGNPNT